MKKSSGEIKSDGKEPSSDQNNHKSSNNKYAKLVREIFPERPGPVKPLGSPQIVRGMSSQHKKNYSMQYKRDNSAGVADYGINEEIQADDEIISNKESKPWRKNMRPRPQSQSPLKREEFQDPTPMTLSKKFPNYLKVGLLNLYIFLKKI